MADFKKKVKVVFVTSDPDRDTPAALKTYLASFNPDFIGLTGTQAQLDAFGITERSILRLRHQPRRFLAGQKMSQPMKHGPAWAPFNRAPGRKTSFARDTRAATSSPGRG